MKSFAGHWPNDTDGGSVPLKIGFVSHSAERGGAERYLVDLIELLGEQGVRAAVAIPRRGPLIEELSRLDTAWSAIPFHWWARRYDKPVLHRAARQAVNAGAALPIARYFRRERVDLIFTNTEMTVSGALAARLLGRPHIWALHELRDPWRFDLGERITSRLMRSTTACFVANSEATLGSHRSALGGAPIRVLYPPVRLPDRIDSGTAPDGSEFRCLLVGTIAPHKGQKEAIEAIRLLRDDHAPISLDLVGEPAEGCGHYFEELRRSVERSSLDDVVRFVGAVDDALPSIRRADLLLQTSAESFGRTVVEAMSVGTPVVASDSGAAAELISHGETGYLYEPGRPAHLAGRIRSVVGSREELTRIAAAAFDSARTRFDPASFRARLLKIFESLL